MKKLDPSVLLPRKSHHSSSDINGEIMRMRRTLAAGAVLAVSTVGLVAVNTSSASAARLAACHSSKTYSQYSSSPDLKRYVSLPITNGPSVNCSLMLGDSGNGVKILQKSLNFCYNTGLTVDGSYGAKTRDAVKKVQNKHGATVDGVYGSETRRMMKWKVDFHTDTTSGSECRHVKDSSL